MRLTGGKARGINLQVPRGDRARPAMGALREAVFSSLGEAVVGAEVLDLFAGVGSYGLEALSRGAASVDWVERDPRCLDCIRQNLTAVEKAMGVGPVRGRLIAADVQRWRPEDGRTYDLVFIDPPYAFWEQEVTALLTLVESALTPGPRARLILEAPGGWSPPTLPGALQVIKRLGRGRHQPVAIITGLLPS